MIHTIGILSSVIVPAIVVGIYFFGMYKRLNAKTKAANRYSDVAGQDGQAIEKTTLAKLGLGVLPFDAATVASSGTKRAAPMTIDDHVLRPTSSIRGISVVLTVVFGIGLFFGELQFLPFGGSLVNILLAATLLYAFVFIQTYELRYNRDRLIAPGRAFNRREHNWRDLVRIQDNGHYLFILTFADGSKLEVQKHLVGMVAFLTFAKAQLAANTSAIQTPKATMRAGGSVFGSRKTFS